MVWKGNKKAPALEMVKKVIAGAYQNATEL